MWTVGENLLKSMRFQTKTHSVWMGPDGVCLLSLTPHLITVTDIIRNFMASASPIKRNKTDEQTNPRCNLTAGLAYRKHLNGIQCNDLKSTVTVILVYFGKNCSNICKEPVL